MFDGAPQTNPAILMIDEVIRINGRLRSIFAGVSLEPYGDRAVPIWHPGDAVD